MPTAPATARRPSVAPLRPARYELRLTIDGETYTRLRRAQDLLRHAIPNGDPAAVIDRALTVLLSTLDRKKLGATSRPGQCKPIRSGSRTIPAAVRRAVWARDGGRCAFVGSAGRCSETGFLEFHHVVPFAVGGLADVATIELRCSAHNRYEAELFFGPAHGGLVRESRSVSDVGRPRGREDPRSGATLANWARTQFYCNHAKWISIMTTGC